MSWEGNQIDDKPNWFVGRQYEYDINEATGERCKLRINGSSNWRYVVDIHESMSFVARPRSEVVGASAIAGVESQSVTVSAQTHPATLGTTLLITGASVIDAFNNSGRITRICSMSLLSDK